MKAMISAPYRGKHPTVFFVASLAILFIIASFAAAATAPVITSGPDEGSTVATSSVTFAFEASGAVLTQCMFGAAPYACGSPQEFSGLGDSAYAFSVAAQDALGEWATTTRTFTVDTSTATSTVVITATAASGGSISPSGAVSVESGGDQSFAITPDSGFDVADVVVDGVSIGTTTAHTFASVTADHTISATFSSVTPVPEPTPPEAPAQTAPSGGGGGIVGPGFGLVESAALPGASLTAGGSASSGGSGTGATGTSTGGLFSRSANPAFNLSNLTAGAGAAFGQATTAGGTGGPYTFLRSLRQGSRGNDVAELQRLLTAEAVYQGPVTGYFGPLTAAGVRRYQAANDLPQVGVVGPLTRAKLNAQ